MRKVVSEQNQMIYDIAIRYMGSVEAVIDIMKLNPAVRFDQVITSGTEVLVPDEPVNKRVVEYMSQNAIEPVSGGFNPNNFSVIENVDINLNTDGDVDGPVWDLGYILGPLNMVIYFNKSQPSQDLFTLNIYTSPDGLNNWTLVPNTEVVVVGGNIFRPVGIPFLEGVYFRFKLSNINVLSESSITKLIHAYEKYS